MTLATGQGAAEAFRKVLAAEQAERDVPKVQVREPWEDIEITESERDALRQLIVQNGCHLKVEGGYSFRVHHNYGCGKDAHIVHQRQTESDAVEYGTFVSFETVIGLVAASLVKLGDPTGYSIHVTRLGAQVYLGRSAVHIP